MTSIVRYVPNSRFPAHDHPEGEGFLVLSGAFGDEHGRCPAGAYVLNPDGARHAPVVDEDGCLLFVELRQYPGQTRRQAMIRTGDLDWGPGETDGTLRKSPYRQDEFAETMELMRIASDAGPVEIEATSGEELLVIAGELIDEHGRYRAGTWIRNPAGHRARRSSRAGATMLRRTGRHMAG